MTFLSFCSTNSLLLASSAASRFMNQSLQGFQPPDAVTCWDPSQSRFLSASNGDDEFVGEVSTVSADKVRLLARSVFRDLKSTGYSQNNITAFAEEILSCVSQKHGGERLRPSGIVDSYPALHNLAKSVFRELKTTGHNLSDIVAFATEIFSRISADIREGRL